ncbi:polysaccharide pyruvyl transferase family protein [Methylomagnum sp.]
MYKICIFGETYSENLGDGVIAESIRHILSRLVPDATIYYHDMTGRRGWSKGQQAQPDANLIPGLKRGLGLNLTGRFKTVRRFYTLLSLLAAKSRGEFPKLDDKALDLAIIGGGQLIMDNELSFPTKIFLLTRELGRETKAIAFYSCGVGHSWSIIGRWLYSRVLKHPRVTALSVRDIASRQNLAEVFGFKPDAIDIIYDPALWAAEAYNLQRTPDSNVIGLGIMTPLRISRVIKPEYTAQFNAEFLTRLWTDTALALIDQGHDVCLFTNGAPEDQSLAEKVLAAIPENYRKRIALCPRPDTPELLVRMIAGFKAIIAQRLHAHVIAYSLKVPSVGLIWGSKVEEFGELTERRQFFMEPHGITASDLSDKVRDAINQGVDSQRRQYLQAEAQTNTIRLLSRSGINIQLPNISS